MVGEGGALFTMTLRDKPTKKIGKGLTPRFLLWQRLNFKSALFPLIPTIDSFSSPLEAKQTGRGRRGGILATGEGEMMTAGENYHPGVERNDF